MKYLLGIVAMSLFLSACVSVQKFDAKQAEYEACRSQAEKDAQAWETQRNSLEADLASITQERGRCQRNYEQAQQTTQDIEKRAAELRHSLQEEITARNVEIETLKGKLSVRVLDRILFKSGSAQILPEGEAVLKKLAAVLVTTNDYIRVEGHTDTVPISARLKQKFFSNWELSAARAASVVRYFEYAHKISPLRLEAVGFSKYRPVAHGESPADLQRNRRVEIILTQPRQ